MPTFRAQELGGVECAAPRPFLPTTRHEGRGRGNINNIERRIHPKPNTIPVTLLNTRQHVLPTYSCCAAQNPLLILHTSRNLKGTRARDDSDNTSTTHFVGSEMTSSSENNKRSIFFKLTCKPYEHPLPRHIHSVTSIARAWLKIIFIGPENTGFANILT